jgi:hypothetical protein
VVLLRRISLAGAIVLAAAVIVTLLARRVLGGGERASLPVTLAGRSAHVAERTTLAGAAALFGLHLHAGDVLDVNGKVLRPGAVPGRFLVDGRPASAGMRLRSGERITVVDGTTGGSRSSAASCACPAGCRATRSSPSVARRASR